VADDLEIAGVRVGLGKRASIDIPVARRYTHAEVFVPTQVVRGKSAGPRLFVSAAIHGDEINGVEIIRRLLRHRVLRQLAGTLIAVPVVNVYGFTGQSRYLPDRRDLNRSFPGSEKGSLAARLAHRFMSEVVGNSTHGIDLHTGARHRYNLPQIRACLDDPETARLARAFGAPVLLDSTLRDGSLREAARQQAIPMLLYEAGEALRFDEFAIRAGVRGILSVMRALKMLPASSSTRRPSEPVLARSSSWVRAPMSGVFRTLVRMGARVSSGQELGAISNPLGSETVRVEATSSGIVIGATLLPLVNEGDALFHVASFHEPSKVAREVEAYAATFDPASDSVPGEEEPFSG
jgi:predicted deacylase